MQRRAEPELIEIDEAAGNVVALFMALDTQWRVHPMTGGRTGLDYASIRSTAELFDLPLDAEAMTDLRVMEIAALEELARRSARR